MATVAHKNLTGTQLHEPKGISSATLGQVYYADGAGSGTWAKLTHAQLQTTGNPFGAQLLEVRDEKTSGTNGGTATAGSWFTHTLNTTKTNEISGASLAANVISLPSGTYESCAMVSAVRVGVCQLRLRNTTDSSDLVTGLNGRADAGANNGTTITLSGRFTLAATKNVELQMRVDVTRLDVGLGFATGWGTEVYAILKIWKVA